MEYDSPIDGANPARAGGSASGIPVDAEPLHGAFSLRAFQYLRRDAGLVHLRERRHRLEQVVELGAIRLHRLHPGRRVALPAGRVVLGGFILGKTLLHREPIVLDGRLLLYGDLTEVRLLCHRRRN